MKLKSINKDSLLCYGIGAMAFALCTGVYMGVNSKVNDDAEYLKQNAPEKYEYLKAKYGIEPFRGSADAWAVAAQMHRDSVSNAQKTKSEKELKINSIVQTNYVKGIKAAQDSLKSVKE